jgi:hypothetical protein
MLGFSMEDEEWMIPSLVALCEVFLLLSTHEFERVLDRLIRGFCDRHLRGGFCNRLIRGFCNQSVGHWSQCSEGDCIVACFLLSMSIS